MERRGGFTLLERSEVKGWLMRHDVDRFINLIQNHHTWLPDMKGFNGQNHFSLLTGMKIFHVTERGFRDIAQNITTFPDGKVAICRDLREAPAGIKGHNSRGICIEHVGNFDRGGDIMTEEHKESIVHLNAVLCHKFNLTPNTNTIVYHHWYDRDTCKRTNGTGETKTCPGTNFFGGNSVEKARQNFVPLIASELRRLRRGTRISRAVSTPAVLGHAMVTATRLNIRKGPSASKEKIGYLNSGSVVDIYNRREGWCRISRANKWVSERYLRDIFYGKVTASALRVRTGPSTAFRIVDRLPRDYEVTIYETQNGWHKIDLNDKWVYGKHIKLLP